MSVIVARALPDARDGLKPVQRRILYAMHRNGHTTRHGTQVGPHRRRRAGQVSPARRQLGLRRDGAHGAGFLHAPAADRRAGEFRLDRRRPPAAMRYTEARLSSLGESCSKTSTRTPSTCRRTSTARCASQRCCRPASPTCSSTALPVSRWACRPISAAQPGRGDRRLHGADRRSGLEHRGSDRHRAGARFPDRRHHSRAGGHPRRLPSRPRLHHHARQGRDRDPARRSRSHHHQRDPLPGEQGHDGRAYRRIVAREEGGGDRRGARRIRPPRLSRGDRDQARRHGRRGAQPALPLHAAAVDLRRQHGGARRRPTAGDEPEGHAAVLRGRVPLDAYRAQKRGGKGRSGMATKEEDFVTRVFVANTHTPVLFFSSRGAGLQGEGLADAAGAAPGARQGAHQLAAA